MDRRVPTLDVVLSNASALSFVVEIPEGFDGIVGREPPAGIVVADAAISRRHARVVHDGHGVWLEDVGSTNGTYVNGDRITGRCRLRDGDEVTFGHSAATFYDVVAASVISDPQGAETMVAEVAVAPPATWEAAPAEPDPRLTPDVWPPDLFPPPRPPPLPTWAEADEPQPRAPGASGGPSCTRCGSPTSPEMWFCHACGHEQRPMPAPPADPAGPEDAGPVGTGIRREQLMAPHGGTRRWAFRRALRAGNGGHRVAYNESLAVATTLFRVLLAIMILAVIVVLVASARGASIPPFNLIR